MTELRNLAARTGDGLTVALNWSPADDAVYVSVADDRSGKNHHSRVPSDKALDAFYHPFCYVDVTDGKTYDAPALSGTLDH